MPSRGKKSSEPQPQSVTQPQEVDKKVGSDLSEEVEVEFQGGELQRNGVKLRAEFKEMLDAVAKDRGIPSGILVERRMRKYIAAVYRQLMAKQMADLAEKLRRSNGE
jgi:hypothetical protein